MRRFATVVLGLSVLLAVIAGPAFAQKTTPPQQVVVTNTSNAPVPVTGVVNLGNVNNPLPVVTPAGTPLAVAVSGIPSVAVTSMPAVTLGAGTTVTLDSGTPVNMIDVTTRPVIRMLCETNTSTSRYITAKCFTTGGEYVVPTGKRLVINNVSAHIILPSGQLPVLYLRVWSAGDMFQNFYIAEHKFPFSSPGRDEYMFNSSAPFYLDEMGRVEVLAYRSDSLDWFGLDAAMQGYLVDCGSGCTQ